MTILGIIDVIKNKLSWVAKERWVFTSFDGHYSDNPKYLSMKLHELMPDIEIVWCVLPQYKDLLPPYVKYVQFGTRKSKSIIASAGVLIDNVYAQRAFSVFDGTFKNKIKCKLLKIAYYKKKQHIYTTWHGTPLKKMGRDQIGNSITDFECCNIIILLGNQFTADIMKHLTFEKVPIDVLGSPRNDILFSSNASILKKKLDLPKDKKVLLFAPTFRNDGKDVEGKNLNRSGINQLNMIDFERLFQTLHVQFGGDWILVCRFHYHVAEMVDWTELDKKYNRRIVNGNLHDDMSEYLACADILLTDASSCMFDFMITGKPCFLFFPDIDNYANKERGMYLDIYGLPFPIASDFKGLLNIIEMFDKAKYSQLIHRLMDQLGYREDGHASERIIRYILHDINNKRF